MNQSLDNTQMHGKRKSADSGAKKKKSAEGTGDGSKKRKTTEPYAKHWMVTTNNPREEDKIVEHPLVDSAVWQLEKGADGTVHVQVNRRDYWKSCEGKNYICNMINKALIGY